MNKVITIPKNSRKTLVWKKLQSQDLILEENSRLLLVLILTKGDKLSHNIKIDLKGDKSSIDVIGFIKGKRGDQFNFTTETLYNGKSSHGHIIIKGIQYDHSSTNYQGLIKVNALSKFADAYMAHHTILLSDDASASTLPSMEILNDEVKAGHAASVGQVDDESMYYLQSRGLNQEEAKELLVKGFFGEVLDKISDKPIQKEVREELNI